MIYDVSIFVIWCFSILCIPVPTPFLPPLGHWSSGRRLLSPCLQLAELESCLGPAVDATCKGFGEVWDWFGLWYVQYIYTHKYMWWFSQWWITCGILVNMHTIIWYDMSIGYYWAHDLHPKAGIWDIGSWLNGFSHRDGTRRSLTWNTVKTWHCFWRYKVVPHS